MKTVNLLVNVSLNVPDNQPIQGLFVHIGDLHLWETVDGSVKPIRKIEKGEFEFETIDVT